MAHFHRDLLLHENPSLGVVFATTRKLFEGTHNRNLQSHIRILLWLALWSVICLTGRGEYSEGVLVLASSLAALSTFQSGVQIFNNEEAVKGPPYHAELGNGFNCKFP